MSAKEFYREKRPSTPDIPPEVWQKIIRHATVVSGVLSPELPPTFGATSSDRNQLREFRKSLVWTILHYLAVFAQLFCRSRGAASYESTRHGTLLRRLTSLNMSFLIAIGVCIPFGKR